MMVNNEQPASPDSLSASSSPALRPSSPSIPLPRLRSTSDLSVHSTDDLWAPDATAAFAEIQDSDRGMEPEQSGHRRRRSSLMNPLNSDADSKRKSQRRRGSPRTGAAATGADDSLTEDPKLERSEDDSLSEGEVDDLSDDGLQDDEETGLTGKDKGRRKSKRRRNTLLDQRIAGEPKVVISDEEKKEADQNVVKKSLINGLLIAMWYVFSLSISIVSSPISTNHEFVLTKCIVQQMDVRPQTSRLPLPPLHNMFPHDCTIHPRLPRSLLPTPIQTTIRLNLKSSQHSCVRRQCTTARGR